MINRKLKKRITILESKLEYQKRFNDEMCNLTRKMRKRLDELEETTVRKRKNK